MKIIALVYNASVLVLIAVASFKSFTSVETLIPVVGVTVPLLYLLKPFGWLRWLATCCVLVSGWLSINILLSGMRISSSSALIQGGIMLAGSLATLVAIRASSTSSSKKPDSTPAG